MKVTGLAGTLPTIAPQLNNLVLDAILDTLKKTGQMFKITSFTKDGRFVERVARFGVKKHLRTNPVSTNNKTQNDNLVTVFVIGQGYRTFKKELIEKIESGSILWEK